MYAGALLALIGGAYSIVFVLLQILGYARFFPIIGFRAKGATRSAPPYLLNKLDDIRMDRCLAFLGGLCET
jgi:hypothetical protein